MTCNKFLATLAATWAARCVLWEYGQPSLGENPPFNTIGQNLFATPESTIYLPSAIRSWFSEHRNYNYETTKCVPGSTCRHYTQLVWATSRQVGCAVHRCKLIAKSNLSSEASYLVCYYGPAGNLPGVKPFIKGDYVCSKCSSGAGWCWDEQLCDSECSSSRYNKCSCAAICFNCATLNQSTCRCTCAAGWQGVDCSERCTDTHKNCKPDPDAEEGKCPPWTRSIQTLVSIDEVDKESSCDDDVCDDHYHCQHQQPGCCTVTLRLCLTVQLQYIQAGWSKH